jgi:hypothetical protein
MIAEIAGRDGSAQLCPESFQPVVSGFDGILLLCAGHDVEVLYQTAVNLPLWCIKFLLQGLFQSIQPEKNTAMVWVMVSVTKG